MNTITHVRLRNFKSFGPNHPGVTLYPLTTVIGPNGTGKTNLLEGLWLALGGMGLGTGWDAERHYRDEYLDSDPRFRRPDDGRPCHHPIDFAVKFSRSQPVEWRHLCSGGSPSFSQHWDMVSKGPAVIHRVELLGGLDRVAGFNGGEDPPYHLTAIVDRLVEQDLLALAAERYTRHTRRPFPFKRVPTPSGNGTASTSSHVMALDVHLSDGQRKFLRLFLTLMDRASNYPLLLDLPETSLHLEDQRFVGELISEAAKYRQIIVATHSPEIFSELDIHEQHYITCELVNGETQFKSHGS